MELNPYAAPQSKVLQTTSEDELTRTAHLSTESTIKTVGALYYLGAFVVILMGLSIFIGEGSRRLGSSMGVGVLLIGLGLGQGMTAYGLRRLQSWARIPATIISCIGLLGFPVGTLINAYILAKVLGKQGQFVVTPEYHRIIAVTPHVKQKTSIVVWVLLILLLIILIGIIASSMLS